MDVKQILIIGLFLVPVWTHKMHRCYDDSELSEAVNRKLSSHYPQPPEPPATATRGSPATCPEELYQQQPPRGDISDRSLAPWRNVLATKEDHFPSTYVEAECLCEGCILIKGSRDNNSDQDEKLPKEDHYNYNSLHIKQKRVFLKRERCNGKNENKYHLTPVIVEVAVGCTCVRAVTSS